jgi:acyl carrier protein
MKTNDFIRKLEESLEIDENSLELGTDLKSIYDSLSILSIIALIDENFNKRLSTNQFQSITTVDSLIELIGKENFED